MVSATLKQEGATASSVFAKNFTLIVGVLLCATAVLAYWFGSYTFTPIEYHMLALPVLNGWINSHSLQRSNSQATCVSNCFPIFLNSASHRNSCLLYTSPSPRDGLL